MRAVGPSAGQIRPGPLCNLGNDDRDIVRATALVGHLYQGMARIQRVGVLGQHLLQFTILDNAGQAVGMSEDRAFVWNEATGIRDLNDLIGPGGWELLLAEDINDLGWIVGQGRNPAGELRAFLLVPEPASAALLGVGALARRRRRRQAADRT